MGVEPNIGGGKTPQISGKSGGKVKYDSIWPELCGCQPKKNGKTPQIIHLFIGFSIVFTIHFGGVTPYFWKHTDLELENLESFHCEVLFFNVRVFAIFF